MSVDKGGFVLGFVPNMRNPKGGSLSRQFRGDIIGVSIRPCPEYMKGSVELVIDGLVIRVIGKELIKEIEGAL